MDKKTLELQIKIIAEQAVNKLKGFNNDIKDAAGKAKGFSDEAKNAADGIKKMKDEAAKAAKEMSGSGLSGVLSELKNQIGSIAVVAGSIKFDTMLAGAVKDAASVSDSFRGIKEEFGIMLGDMEAGAGFFNELQEFNFWTPFDIEQTAKAAKVLMAAKVPLADITSYMTRFGDIAQGDSQKFNSFINAFSKASAKGKADMEVLNVYMDQGVQILDALGSQLGISSAQVVELSSKGKISFQDLDNALASMAAEGGLYYQSMETAAMRLSSVQAGLEESVKSLKASIGDMLAPIISKVLEIITNLIDAINNSPFLKGTLIATITAVTAALNIFAVKTLITLITNTNIAKVAVAALSTTMNTMLGPVGLVILALGAAAGIISTVAAKHQQAADATAEHALELKKLQDSYNGFISGANMDEASKSIGEYSKKVAEQIKLVGQLEAKLKNTPKEVIVTYGKYQGEDIQTRSRNTEYDRLEKELTAAKENLQSYQNSLSKAQQRVQELKDKMKSDIENLGTEWQSKILNELPNSIEKIELQRVQSLEALKAKAEEIYGSNFATWEAYKSEESALQTYYNNKVAEEQNKIAKKAKEEAEKRLAEEKKIAEERSKAQEVVDKWTNNSDLEAQLISEKKRAQEELVNAAKTLWGDAYAQQAEYIKANAELELEYAERIAKAKAGGKKTFSEEMSEISQSMTSGTDVGIIIDAIQNGGSVWGALIQILIKCVSSLESFQKAVNLISESLKTTFSRLDRMLTNAINIVDEFIDVLADAFTPIMAICIAFSNVFTKNLFRVLEPILSIIQNIFEVLVNLYNNILVPLSFVLANFLNVFVDIINSLGANLNHFEAFEEIVIETAELSELIEKQQEQIKKKYQRMEDAIKEQLDSQLSALKSQYELGLISRAEYESQAEKYAVETDDKIFELEKKMESELEKIEKNTLSTSSSTNDVSTNVKTTNTAMNGFKVDFSSFSSKINSILNNGFNTIFTIHSCISSIISTITSGLNGIINSITKINIPGLKLSTITSSSSSKNSDSLLEKILDPLGIGNLFGWWDVGSWEIPQDQIGMVHKGETIIPKNFAEGIRSGKLSLSGGNNQEQKSEPLVINLTVEGSVVTENELIDSVYQGIRAGINSRQYKPLGVA